MALGLVRRKLDGVRLLGKGELTAAAERSRVTGASKSAVEAVEKAGGSCHADRAEGGRHRRVRAARRPPRRRRNGSLPAPAPAANKSGMNFAPPRPRGPAAARYLEGRMASAAEQMAANLSWGTFGKAKDLQSRILFALGLLIVYRIGTYIPVPGVDAARLQQFFEQQSDRPRRHAQHVHRRRRRADGDLLARHHAVHLGLDHRAAPRPRWSRSLATLKKEGEAGRKKINQYTRYGTVFLATFQAYGLALGLEAEGMAHDPGWFFRLGVIVTLVGGTMFLMWLGEQITARGIGNGISLIIFTGIVAHMPRALAQFFTQGRTGAHQPGGDRRRSW